MLELLMTAEFDDHWVGELGKLARVERVGFSLDLDPASRLDRAGIIRALEGKDILLAGYERITAEVLAASPQLKLILSVRDGPEENIDLDVCTRLGIPVLFSGGRCERSVPEFTFGAMLLMAKPVIRANRVMRQERWTAQTDLALRRISEGSTELSGKTLGIIGLGRNGRGLARRAGAFEMELVGYDPYVTQEDAGALGVRLCGLEELMASSDYIAVLARVTPETRGMVSRELIGMMKPGACLVNTARGVLVDNAALLEALAAGRVRAALDVFDGEPPAADSAIYDIPEERLLMTPHMAGPSVERVSYQSQKLCGFLGDYLAGRMPENLANPQVVEGEGFAARGGAIFGK